MSKEEHRCDNSYDVEIVKNYWDKEWYMFYDDKMIWIRYCPFCGKEL